MNIHHPEKEVLWISGIFVVTVAIVLPYIVGGNTTLDIQLHDTYFVVPVFQVFVFLFLNLGVVVYLIRQLQNRFRVAAQNITLAITSAALIPYASLLLVSHSLFTGRWTRYSPDGAATEVPESYAHDQFLNPWIFGYQLFLVAVFGLALFFAGRSFRAGRDRELSTHSRS